MVRSVDKTCVSDGDSATVRVIGPGRLLVVRCGWRKKRTRLTCRYYFVIRPLEDRRGLVHACERQKSRCDA